MTKTALEMVGEKDSGGNLWSIDPWQTRRGDSSWCIDPSRTSSMMGLSSWASFLTQASLPLAVLLT